MIGQPLVGHTEHALCATISNDDRFVVSGSDDGTVRVWNVRGGETIAEPLEHDIWLASVFMSRDNQQIISVDFFNKAYLRSAFAEELLESTARAWTALDYCGRRERDGTREMKRI